SRINPSETIRFTCVMESRSLRSSCRIRDLQSKSSSNRSRGSLNVVRLPPLRQRQSQRKNARWKKKFSLSVEAPEPAQRLALSQAAEKVQVSVRYRVAWPVLSTIWQRKTKSNDGTYSTRRDLQPCDESHAP